MNKSDTVADERLIAQGVEVLRVEADAVAALGRRIDASFAAACRMILACRGRVVVSGIGKSGHVARKIAASFASTGTPSFFVHPAEASHGDLGMITRDDVFLALSYSGSTDELLAIVPLVKRQGAGLLALTGDASSRLAAIADVHLDARVDREACPMNLAPTASTTAALALGDALVVAVLDARGFGPDDFARSHPGGALGRRLLTTVADVMRTGEAIPAVGRGVRLVDAVLEMSRKRMGMTAVVDGERRVLGVFTDGDLRRLIERGGDLGAMSIEAAMNAHPVSIRDDVLAAEAVRTMEERRVNQLLVSDAHGRLVGALGWHDLLAAKVV